MIDEQLYFSEVRRREDLEKKLTKLLSILPIFSYTLDGEVWESATSLAVELGMLKKEELKYWKPYDCIKDRSEDVASKDPV